MKKSHKLKIAKYAILATVIVFLFTTYFRTSVPEISMRSIVNLIGVDKSASGIKVTANVLVPVSDGNTKVNQIMIEAEGDNVYHAISNLSTASGTKVELAHCGMLIFGRDLCVYGILPELKLLFGSTPINPGVVIVATDGVTAGEFVKMSNNIVDESTIGLNGFVTFFEESMYMPMINLIDFLSSNITESRAGYMPCMELIEKEANSTSGSQQSGGKSESSSTFIDNLSSSFIFKNGQKTAKLNMNETRGIVWTQPQMRQGLMTINNFESADIEYGRVMGNILNKKSKLKISFKNGKPCVKFKIHAEISIIDSFKYNYDLDRGVTQEPGLFNSIQTAFEEEIFLFVQSAAEAMKKYDTDFFNIKYAFMRKKNKQMKEYENNAYSDFLKDLIVEYDIKCNVK